MAGIEPELSKRIHNKLLECSEFESDSKLRAIFVDARISPWQDHVPQAATAKALVQATVAFLNGKTHADTGENGLVLLLLVLSDQRDPKDQLCQDLIQLANELKKSHSVTSRPPTTQLDKIPHYPYVVVGVIGCLVVAIVIIAIPSLTLIYRSLSTPPTPDSIANHIAPSPTNTHETTITTTPTGVPSQAGYATLQAAYATWQASDAYATFEIADATWQASDVTHKTNDIYATRKAAFTLLQTSDADATWQAARATYQAAVVTVPPTAIITAVPAPTPTPLNTSFESHPIFMSGKLEPGYDMGVNTSDGNTNWVNITSGEICMGYLGRQKSGDVFITVGKPRFPPRPSKDLSAYRTMSLELKSDVDNESILIGVKDNLDPDDRSETKYRVEDLTTDWQKFEIPLSKFTSADFSKVYVVIEFIFENTPKTICARNIQYLR